MSQEITINQGETFVFDFTYKDNPFTGAPILKGFYRPDIDSSDLTEMTGVATVVDGIIYCQLYMTAAATAALSAPNKGVWECELVGTVGDDTNFVVKPFSNAQKAIVTREAGERV